MNARSKAHKTPCTTCDYENEMEKYLNMTFRNLRALEEIRRTRVSRIKCDQFGRIHKTESLAELPNRLVLNCAKLSPELKSSRIEQGDVKQPSYRS